MTAEAFAPPSFSWRRFLAIAGPGLVVMLADTDAGSVITAAQSGAQWGYKLLMLQFILIPILYIVQELTVRLGAVTGRGHAELIKQHFGVGWAWLSVATLIVCLPRRPLDRVCRPRRRRQPHGRAGAGHAGAGRGGDAGDGAHARVHDGRAHRDRCRRLRARLSAGRHPGASKPRRGRVRGDDDAAHAIRSIFSSPRPTSARSSCRGWCFSSSPRWSRRGVTTKDLGLRPARHRGRRGPHPAHHGRGAGRGRRDARQGGRRSAARHGRGNRRGDHAIPRRLRRQAPVRPRDERGGAGGGDRRDA